MHLEGAMRQPTLREFAARHGLPSPVDDHDATFDAFQRRYRHAVSLIRTQEDLRRIVDEVVEDAASCGAVWIEPQFNPSAYVPTLFHHPEDALEYVLDAAGHAAKRHDVGVGMMLVASRNRDPGLSAPLARLAAHYTHRGVVAFGLAGNEHATAIEHFREAFRIAKQAGLICAPHVGEFTGAREISAALDALAPDRIAHGIRAIESKHLMQRLAGAAVTLDVSLHSNLHLKTVPDLRQHPLPTLLNSGIHCTLGSDDPLLLGSDLLAEYKTARSKLSLADSQLADIARASVSSSAAPPTLIAHAKARITKWLDDAPNLHSWCPHAAE